MGVNGRVADGGVWKECSLQEQLKKPCNAMNIPEPSPLPNDAPDKKIPYSFVADAAFPLTELIMNPFPDKGMTPPQRVFNYRLSRARR